MSLEQQVGIVTEIRGKNGDVIEVFDEKEILFGIADKALGDSLEFNDLGKVGEALKRFRYLSQASSLSAAKLLHGINQNWMDWDHEEGDTFLEWAVRETGYDRQTIIRRTCEWEFLKGHYIPKEFRSRIEDYTVRQLDKIYSICVTTEENKEGGYLNFVEEDYEIDHDDWLKLSEALDDRAVSDTVREIKGKEKNVNNMSFKVDNDGVVWVYQGKDSQTVAQLFTEKDVELVKKAIRRICKNTPIDPRNEY
jgi:hypothetical protein